MIRVVEPARLRHGFLGRSTCVRPDMDLGSVIARSHPVRHYDGYMTHTELSAFDAARAPLLLRDAVVRWPTPYVYERVISLPMIWQHTPHTAKDLLFEMNQRVHALAFSLQSDGEIQIRMRIDTFGTERVTGPVGHKVPFLKDGKLLILSGLQFRQIDFVIHCAGHVKARCDALDVDVLRTQIEALRDQTLLGQTIAQATPPAEDDIQRNILRADALIRSTIVAPASVERRFQVEWYGIPKP